MDFLHVQYTDLMSHWRRSKKTQLQKEYILTAPPPYRIFSVVKLLKFLLFYNADSEKVLLRVKKFKWHMSVSYLHTRTSYNDLEHKTNMNGNGNWERGSEALFMLKN